MIYPGEGRILHVWKDGAFFASPSFEAGTSPWSIQGTPFRVLEDEEGIRVDVGALEPIDVLLLGYGLIAPPERPVAFGQHQILVAGPGPHGAWAVQFWYARERSFPTPLLDPIRGPRMRREETKVVRRDETEELREVEVVGPGTRRFRASLSPLTDDDVAAWVDAGASPPPGWPNRAGPGPAVGLGPEEAAAVAGFHRGRLPTEEEWDALTGAPGVRHIGTYWEWTSTPRKRGFVVRGGRYRDRLHEAGSAASRSWEDASARDIVVRIVRDVDDESDDSTLSSGGR